MTMMGCGPKLCGVVRTTVSCAVFLCGVHAAVAGTSEQVARGGKLYADNCATCHGVDGARGEGYQTPIWGPGTQIAKFGHAQGLFEYLQMLMPFDDPTKLTDAQKWDVVAYMLANHGIIPRTDALDPVRAATVTIGR
jgi:mono/diheme cytochrome c family protein